MSRTTTILGVKTSKLNKTKQTKVTILKQTPSEDREQEQLIRDRINQLFGFFVGLFVAVAIKVVANYLIH